jgi:uncharacterized protein (DUF342 family)
LVVPGRVSQAVADTMVKLPREAPTLTSEIAKQRPGDGWNLLLAITTDRLTASVQLQRLAKPGPCDPEVIIAFVKGAGLALSPEEEQRLPALAAQLAEGGGDSLVVAQGTPAEVWAEIDWLIPIGITRLRDYSDETIDLHEVSQFINVRQGQPLCLLPPPPRPGRSVYGAEILPEACPFQLGDRVATDPENPAKVVATEAGCARFLNGRLSVEQILELPGDLTFKIGNIDFNGDVIIHGSVQDGFHIKSAKNVMIDGGVGMSTIEAGGAITIKGGVNGGHKGRLVATGNVQAHYLHKVDVESGSDVGIDIESHDSTIRAGGSITVSRGALVGGAAYAGKDISAGFIGASMSVPTLVHAGFQPGLDGVVEKPRQELATTRRTLRSLESMVTCMQRSNLCGTSFPSQRKTQLTQMQTRLADARIVLKNLQTALAAQVQGLPLTGAHITTQRQIFPKVTMVIDSVCEQEVAEDLPGPVNLVANPETLAIEPVKRPEKNAK